MAAISFEARCEESLTFWASELDTASAPRTAASVPPSTSTAVSAIQKFLWLPRSPFSRLTHWLGESAEETRERNGERMICDVDTEVSG